MLRRLFDQINLSGQLDLSRGSDRRYKGRRSWGGYRKPIRPCVRRSRNSVRCSDSPTRHSREDFRFVRNHGALHPRTLTLAPESINQLTVIGSRIFSLPGTKRILAHLIIEQQLKPELTQSRLKEGFP